MFRFCATRLEAATMIHYRRSAGHSVILLKDLPGIGRAGEIVRVDKRDMRHDYYPNRVAVYDIDENRLVYAPLILRAQLEWEHEVQERKARKLAEAAEAEALEKVKVAEIAAQASTAEGAAVPVQEKRPKKPKKGKPVADEKLPT
eukprot:TRINITY_DN7061_c0_g1_i1.p1 TRINITY_DN7061_c0_g1~~TRINITY_DN7061_c0_g1_i1.p1  ORF type:complete len:153 (-),score=31.09 TRINITY_DN7061_c0_g1_i1:9-443(-)